MSDENKEQKKRDDVEELKEVLAVVSTEIPKLLDSISSTLYKTENAENLGKSVALFFKQMKDAGMTDQQAFELTQKYMQSFSVGGMLSQVMQSGAARGSDFGDKIGEQIDRKMKEKFKKLDDSDD